ncbi:MAG: M1 family metallopeptidase [Deltaproteobacteria bacterium]|nr:M1 family metallopeptidase [Deltaproteobacteria bacterium]
MRLSLLALLLFATSLALRFSAVAGDSTAGDSITKDWPATAPAPRSGLPSKAPPLRYRIHARVDAPAGRIRGDVKLQLRNTSQVALTELRLHLYLNAFASKDTRFMRSSRGAHRGHSAGDPGWIKIQSVEVGEDKAESTKLLDGTVASVRLPRRLDPGTAVEVTITFEAQLPQLFARTGRAGELLMGAQWYPKLGFLRPDGSWHCPEFHANSEFFAQFADYDVTLDLPARTIVGATGERVATPSHTSDTSHTSNAWRRHHFRARWVHDFAFVAWPHFKRVARRIEGIDVELLTVPGRDPERQMQLVRYGLAELSRLLAPYPYPRLTIVDLPSRARPAAAMEYPTLFTTLIPMWTPSWHHAGDEITLHELTHQLFQGIVATNEVEEPWLDEGLTTYVSGLLLERRFGPARSVSSLGPLHLGQREKNQLHMLMAPVAPVAGPAASFPSWASYGANVYGRAASLFFTLESLMGQDRVLRALRRYVAKGRFAHPQGEHLEAELLAASPPEVRAAVVALLQGVLREGSRLDARLSCGQAHIEVERRGGLHLPLELHWRDVHGKHYQRQLTKSIPVERHPTPGLREAWLGPPGRLSLDASPADNRCLASDGRWAISLRYLPLLRQLLALVGP